MVLVSYPTHVFGDGSRYLPIGAYLYVPVHTNTVCTVERELEKSQATGLHMAWKASMGKRKGGCI